MGDLESFIHHRAERGAGKEDFNLLFIRFGELLSLSEPYAKYVLGIAGNDTEFEVHKSVFDKLDRNIATIKGNLEMGEGNVPPDVVLQNIHITNEFISFIKQFVSGPKPEVTGGTVLNFPSALSAKS